MTDSRDVAPIGSRDTLGETISDQRDLSAIPGYYFTAISDIEPRVETSELEDRFGGKNGEKTEIQYQARRAVAAGTTLLALKLNFLDDILHSVVLAAHPEDKDRKPLAFMADEFFTHFLPEPGGEEKRDEAIAAIQSEMKDIRKQIATRPEAGEAPLLLSPGQKKPTTTDLVRYQNRSQDIAARMDQTVAAAKELEAHVKNQVAILNERSTVLQRYMMEKADASLAAISDTIEFAQEVKSGVKTLSLYTGEGEDGATVEVQTVAAGQDAPASEPLRLYQNLLYLDEELAVDLLDGGFDFTRMDDIGNILSADGTLIERMIPSQRGAVLVRIRRENKNYFLGDDSLAAALRNAQLNMENMVTYLLVRNGENIHLVHSEVTTDLTKHFFPTRHEIDEIFRDYGRDIRPEHLEYSRVKSDFEKRTLYYKRILLMLWGLDDRLGLFGPFYDRNVFDSWYDDRFHAERIVYVHDVENAIGEDRPNFAQWVAAKNAIIQPGSHLAVDWSKLITEASAPYCFNERRSGSDRPSQRYVPVERFGTAVVSVKEDRLVVKTTVRHKWHDEFRHKRNTFNTTVDLEKGVMSSPPTAICLDEVTRDEIKYYLNSRKQRENYLSYLQLFRIMDDILRKDEEMEAATLAQLRAGLSHSGVCGHRAERALRTAVGMWRAANGGAFVGGEGWKPKNANQILDLALALAGERNDIFERARKDLPCCVPIDLRINGKGQFILYWKIPDDRRPAFLSVFDDVFVMRSILKVRRDRVEYDGEAALTYAHNPGFRGSRSSDDRRTFRRQAREISLVSDAEQLARATQKHLPDWTTAEEAAHIHAICDFDAKEALAKLSVSTAEAEIGHRVLNTVVHKNHVNPALVVIPLGILVRHDRVHVLAIECSGLEFLAGLGEGSRAFAETLITRRYKNSSSHLARMGIVAQTSSREHPPMKLMSTSHWSELDAGINFLNENAVWGRSISTRGYQQFTGESSAPYATILESVLSETDKEYREGVSVHYLHDGSRALADAFFEAQRERK